MSDGSIETQIVGAIRLALEGAANDETALTLIQWLVRQAPATVSNDTGAVQMLVDGIRDLGLSVSTDSPSGAYSPAEAADGD